jgi:vacuolar-type H+-ATPase subunit H
MIAALIRRLLGVPSTAQVERLAEKLAQEILQDTQQEIEELREELAGIPSNSEKLLDAALSDLDGAEPFKL